MAPSVAIIGVTLLSAVAGCHTSRGPLARAASPTDVGLNTRDVVDPVAQPLADAALTTLDASTPAREAGDAARERAGAAAQDARHVLCLSGGGSYGAYAAGVLCGWTQSGRRPAFDVVTGISTGALIAPFAFLGPRYDGAIRHFYTETRTRDVYVKRPVRGLFSEALADDAPLRRTIDGMVTWGFVADIAAAHREGRRLYVGTTELEGRRFIVWDVGGIACRGRPDDRALICDVLAASAAIPGFFPPVRIPVSIDGRVLAEKHGDGGVTQGIFFRPPWPPDRPAAGTRVWCVVAGKLYADPAPLRPRALAIAGRSLSDIIFAQTRGDLQRIYTLAQLNGMDFQMTAIADDFPAPAESTEFNPPELRAMFDEGFRQAQSGRAWRGTPPGVAPGEAPRERAGTCLTEVPKR
ncbi:patatin-like phospholipase family protein [Limnoglobus roseus]|uniref:Patatin-like phospholipase n=1 Tax=Limnoglobus roseus TaxID=2598579 RepID=A0A5C1AI01_9BACT|nr:patatin-like phospholipase family protein [Limnoglobus roseus]QEL17626.1 patatin-like phospholipase [Limnoglobus roseus]